MKSLCALLALVFAAACEAAAPVQVDRDVAVPMRDGVVLRADIYRPDRKGRFPVLVYRTPYGKHFATDSEGVHLKAVARGYAVLLQDVRGRYASDGVFNPYRQEGADGYDTIEWAAKQPWSDGRIGTYGLSYPGAVQWLAAMEQPPHLLAMAPAMTFSSPRRFFYMGGIFDRSWLPWIYQNVAPDARRRLGLPDEGDAEENWRRVAAQYESFLPLRELPWLRREAPYYFEWLAHPPEDPWWDWAELRYSYRKTSAAVLNLSGWYDDAYGVEGAATNFSGLLGTRDADRPRTHLVIGPWDHGAPSATDGRVGDLDFGPNAAIDYDGLILDFLDYYVRGIANRFATEPPVRYFVMGANEWRESDTWPVRRRGFKTFRIQKGGDGRPGDLIESPNETPYAASELRADPDKPVLDPYDATGPHDYGALGERKDVLTFDSGALSEDLTIGPEYGALIYVSCDCRDFDLWARLLDVHPDGRAYNVASAGNDVLRASASVDDCGKAAGPLEPGRRYALNFSRGMSAIRFGKGHRLRLQLSASFDPHLSRNLQTGESEITSSKSQTATISIHQGPGQESRLVLPVLEGEPDPTPVMQ